MLPWMIMAAASGAGSIVVNLDGHSTSDVSSVRVCTAGFRLNGDGTIEQLINVTWTQIDSVTDWIIPNSAASIDYDVRVTNVVFNEGSAFTTESAAEDAWVDLGSTRAWTVQDTDSGATGAIDVDFDFEIRDPNGDTVASAAYSLIADYDNS